MISERKLSVFVSSTSEDLYPHRAIARLAILDMGWMPVMMEHFGAMPEPTVAACKKKLAGCDVMLLIVAFRRGWVPTKEQGGDGNDSVTAHELAFARERKIPVLAMFASEEWPRRLCEKDPAAVAWIEDFRTKIDLPVTFFDPEQDEKLPIFSSKVHQVLLGYREDRLAKESSITAEAGKRGSFESACQPIVEGEAIPFIGPGLYGDGPLSPHLLARAMGAGDCGNQTCLATVCEWFERRKATRDLFLKQFRQEIDRQAKQQKEPPAVYNMLLDVNPPKLIISTVCDLELEGLITKRGKKYVLVSHVLRCTDSEHDGKILIWRDGEANLFPADKVDVPAADYVIYKLLGSPLLAGGDPDTVVVTETDHALLLGRLESKATGLPQCFSRLLQRRLVVFAGYGLDDWPHRLVMQIFRSIGGRVASFAVRDKVSPVEEAAWAKLGTNLIEMDVNTFAERVSASAATAGRAQSA